MADGLSERVLRSKVVDLSYEEALVQKIVERVLCNKLFLDKIMCAVTAALSQHEKDIKALENKVSALEEDIKNTNDSLELQEQYSRLNSVRIFGVPVADREDTEAEVIKLCKEKLHIDIVPSDIDCCHRLSKNEGIHKPIIVKFCRRSVKMAVYKAKGKLKGSKVIIREDLTRRRFSLIKAISKKINFRNIFTNNGKIFIKTNDKTFKINALSDYNNIKNELFAH